MPDFVAASRYPAVFVDNQAVDGVVGVGSEEAAVVQPEAAEEVGRVVDVACAVDAAVVGDLHGAQLDGNGVGEGDEQRVVLPDLACSVVVSGEINVLRRGEADGEKQDSY